VLWLAGNRTRQNQTEHHSCAKLPRPGRIGMCLIALSTCAC